MGLGSSSAKTDRKQQLAGWGDLSKVFGFSFPTGTQAVSSGLSSLGNAQSYWNNLLSGNRTSMLQAAAPEVNAIQSGADASRRNLNASGTARGGGVASQNQQQQTNTQAQIDNALLGVRPQAAQGAASTGATTTGLGLDSISQGANAAGTISGQAGESRPNDYKINQDIVGKTTQAIINALAYI